MKKGDYKHLLLYVLGFSVVLGVTVTIFVTILFSSQHNYKITVTTHGPWMAAAELVLIFVGSVAFVLMQIWLFRRPRVL